jgi:hypothetical protein
MLAEVLGVPNPDDDGDADDMPAEPVAQEQDDAGLELYELRSRLMAL